MEHLWRWRKILIVLAIVILAGLIYNTSQPRERLTFIEQGLRDLLSPLQLLMTRLTRGVDNVITGIKELRTIRQQNAYLEGRIVELQNQVYRLSEYQRENVLNDC